MNKLLIHKCVVTVRYNADVCIPCTHCPACGIVGVKRDSVGIVFDELKISKELGRSCGKFIDSRIRKYFLVVKNALCICHVRDTVALSAKFPCIDKVKFLGKIVQRIKRHEICCKIALVNCGDEHYVSPVAC